MIDALGSTADWHNSFFIELIIWSIRRCYCLKILSISAIPLRHRSAIEASSSIVLLLELFHFSVHTTYLFTNSQPQA